MVVDIRRARVADVEDYAKIRLEALLAAPGALRRRARRCRQISPEPF